MQIVDITSPGEIRQANYETRFSGEKVAFDTGATRESKDGKGRFDLLSPIANRRTAQVLERGAKNHGPRNWEKGIPFSSLISSALRHLNQWVDNERCGNPQEEDHLAQARFNIDALMDLEERLPSMNDLRTL